MVLATSSIGSLWSEGSVTSAIWAPVEFCTRGAVLLERGLALRIDDVGEVADVAFRLQRLPIDCEESSDGQREDGATTEQMIAH